MSRPLGVLVTRWQVIDPRFGVELRRRLCTGDVEIPSFMEKLLSEKRYRGDRGLGESFGG
jgi:hypothetical protein